MEHWHVISTWDNILEAMKTLQNLIVWLLKEETLIIFFAKQKSSDTTFYSCNLKKRKFWQVEFGSKKDSRTNSCIKEKRNVIITMRRPLGHWERECKKVSPMPPVTMCSLGKRPCFHQVSQLTIGSNMRTTEWIGRLMATTWDTYPLIYMGTIVVWLTIVCSRKHTPFPTSNKLTTSG
jgi:hypothetical protein